jgi:integrase
LTHLLVEDVDLTHDVLIVRSKPWMHWTVKTGRERQLPLLPATREILVRAIGGRKAGFVFLNAEYLSDRLRPAHASATPPGFKGHVERLVAELLGRQPDADEREQKRIVVAFCRTMGQIPEKRLRCEFMALTQKIGCPEFTRVHDLRHLFTSRAQAAGINPILVQEMLGHTTLEMTRRYTHLGIETKREALQRLAQAKSGSGDGGRDTNDEEATQEECPGATPEG